MTFSSIDLPGRCGPELVNTVTRFGGCWCINIIYIYFNLALDDAMCALQGHVMSRCLHLFRVLEISVSSPSSPHLSQEELVRIPGQFVALLLLTNPRFIDQRSVSLQQAGSSCQRSTQHDRWPQPSLYIGALVFSPMPLGFFFCQAMREAITKIAFSFVETCTPCLQGQRGDTLYLLCIYILYTIYLDILYRCHV